MKSFARVFLTLTAALSCGTVFAQATSSADQERRDRNREEILAKHPEAQRYMSGDKMTMPERGSNDDSLRRKTHKAAQATRGFSHRQAEKMRRFGERTNRRFEKKEPR